MEYQIIRSDRRTLAIQIKDGQVIVRVPWQVRDTDISKFVNIHREWIKEQLKKEAERKCCEGEVLPLSQEELEALVREAKKTVTERVEYYAPLVGVSYGKITVRKQRTRWGSCTANGTLSFNCLLMLAPSEVLDSVVVHELCHRKYMNHSKEFYREILRVFPEYEKWNGWLRRNGNALVRRMERK